jgi:hypothetical protein
MADDKKPKGDYGSHSEAGYADPGLQDDKKPRYPLKDGGELSEERIRAAWSYINKPKNAAKYSDADVKAIKAKIVAAWKAKIDKDGPPSAADGKGLPLTRIEFKVTMRQRQARAKRLSDTADGKSDAIDEMDEPTAEHHAGAARAHAAAVTAAYRAGMPDKADHHQVMARRHARSAKKIAGEKGYASVFETAAALDEMDEAKTLMSEKLQEREEEREVNAEMSVYWDLQWAVNDAIRETLGDDQLSPDDKLAEIGESLDEFKDAVLAWAADAASNDVTWPDQAEMPAVIAKALAGIPVARAAKQGAETKDDSAVVDVPEDFLQSVAQLKQLVTPKGAQ